MCAKPVSTIEKSTTTINSSSQVAGSGSGSHTIDGTKLESWRPHVWRQMLLQRGVPKARKEEYGA